MDPALPMTGGAPADDMDNYMRRMFDEFLAWRASGGNPTVGMPLQNVPGKAVAPVAPKAMGARYDEGYVAAKGEKPQPLNRATAEVRRDTRDDTKQAMKKKQAQRAKER